MKNSITYNGKTQSLADWCRELNLSYSNMKNRIGRLHWPIDRAFSEQIRYSVSNRKSLIKSQRLNKIYKDLKARCYNPNKKDYKWYGGKGIKVYSEWLCSERVKGGPTKGFLQFQEWAFNNGYKDDLTIDRIDSSKDYSPDNCRWITIQEQQSNKSSNHWITYKGEIKTLLQWSKELRMWHGTIRHRLCNLHWTVEKAFETPVVSNRRSHKDEK